MKNSPSGLYKKYCTCDVRKINRQFASNPDDFPADKNYYENDQPPLLALTKTFDGPIVTGLSASTTLHILSIVIKTS